MTQTTEGTGLGSVEKVFPKLVNGLVKLENLSHEVEEKILNFSQNNIGDNNYTLALSDMGKHIYATDCTITVPYYYDVDFPVGTRMTIVSGSLSIIIERDGSSTTIWAEGSDFGSYLVGQRSVVHLLKTNQEEWYLYGDNITVND